MTEFISRDQAEAGRYFDLRPQFVQDVLACRDRRVLIDGPLGTGKTRVNLEKMRACCLKYPRCRWLLGRSVRKWLTNSALVTWEEKVVVPGELMPDRIRRESRSEYRFRNGSVVVVTGLDDPQGVFSAEYDGVVLVEAIEMDQDTVEKIDGRLRYGRMPYHQLLMDCNPGPPTHWLHRAFTSGWCRRFPMRHTDNPALYKPDGGRTRLGVEYLAALDGLTGVRRDRLRDGKWVQAEGVVYEAWNAAVHVVDRRPIPPDWVRYLAIDFGYTNPFVCQFWAEDPDGRLYLYREIVRTKSLVEDNAKLIRGLIDQDAKAAEAMMRVELENRRPADLDRQLADIPARAAKAVRPRAVICDHDAEDRATFERHFAGGGTVPAEKAVTVGVQAVTARLAVAGDGKPRLYVFRDALLGRDAGLDAGKKPCGLAEELDAYVWDTREGRPPKETPVKEDDHSADAARYMVMFKDAARPVPRIR